jgi:O-acetyl-ADP-ribose deacetylase (regulator of RNase III)
MLHYETGDLINEDYPVFCHQVNCKGVMGAGIAKQIKNTYPEVYKEYKDICNNDKAILGVCHFTKTHDGRICIDMFAQDGYGKDKCYTSYSAFRSCLRGIRHFLTYTNRNSVAFPFGIGCGLAGGDWNKIEEMIKELAVDFDVTIVKLEK